MASDGTIKITTELDNQQAEQALSKFGKLVKTGIAALGISKIASEIGQLGGYIFQTGLQFESAFAGVEKTVDATDAELQEFRDGIREMSTEIPQTASEIASVAEAAGQLGIKNEYLLGFTETMSNLGVATNMGATEAATSLARLANITQMPQENFDRLGSTIVALGNNLATTESEITEMGLRLAGAGKQVGMSEAQILGLAGAISSVGIEADAGGSAVSTIMTKMQLAVEKGGESLEQFANVAGMSADEFSQAFRNDAAQALVAFVEGLGTMDSRGQSAIATLSDMEITEIRQRDALLRLAGAGDVLSESLGIATQAWDENNALTNEAEKRYQTLESQIQLLKNNVSDFAISLYDGIRDPMAEVVTEAVGYVERLHSAFNTNGISGVVGELGEIFDDVTDDIAGTSKAAAGIITPLKNIATTGADLAREILPEMADGAEILAENFDTLLPLATGVAAAYKGLSIGKGIANSTSKLGSVVQKGTSWWKNASKAIRQYTEQMEAAKYTGRQYNVELTAGQAILGAFRGKVSKAAAATKALTKAQTALSAAIAANPIGVAVAGVTAMIAAGTAMRAVMSRQTEAEREHSKALRENAEAAEENLKAAQERKKSYEEFVQTQNEQAAGDVAQLDRLRKLNDELNTIVDANGRVKAGEEDRAAFITSQLSSALGMEISMTDSVIGNYQELQGQIQSTIQQKRIDAVMTAQQAKFEEAVANRMQAASEASAAYTAMKEAENDVKKESAELAKLEAEQDQAVLDGNKALVGILGEKIKKQKENVTVAQEAYDENKKSYEDSTAVLAQYANDIDMYTALAEAAASGNAEAIEQAINQITAGIKTASAATNEELQQQVIDVANTQEWMRQEIEKGSPYITQAMLNEAQDATKAALEEFAKVAPQTAEELAKVPPEAVAALVAGDMRGQLSAEASGAVEGMLNQFDRLDEETREAFALAIYGALEGLEGFEQLKDPAKEGADAFLESLREALDEHSPSRATEEIFRLAMEGAKNGITNNQEGVLTAAGEFITAFLGKFTESGLGEKLMGIGSTVMSFFGIGIGSQSENSRAAGQANADAANAGAGSVNPFGTGGIFGSLFGSGVSGASGTAWGAGSTLANNADSGAGSKNPSGTGGKFGSQYASGVGSKSGEARSQGKLLGTSAEGGARTADGSSSGSNFGAGFVSGIRGWLGRAASAAAELAMSAYNALRNALTERSPSRKTKKSGKNFDLGFGLGIDENADVPVKSAEDMTARTLDALDTDALQAKLQELDIPETMSKVYMAVDDKNAQVAANMVSGVKAKEDLAWSNREKDQTVHISDADMERFVKEAAKITKRPIVVYSVINGKVAAKAMVEPMENELDRNAKLNAKIWKGQRS